MRGLLLLRIGSFGLETGDELCCKHGHDGKECK